MDKVDRKLLATVLLDSRTSTTQLAKAAGVSREVATYRLERFIRKKIIQSFITRIDIKKLGFAEAAFFLDITPAREEEFAAFLERCPYISWVGRWTGKWSYGMSIVGKNQEQVDQHFQHIFEKFKEDITQHCFIFHKGPKFFHEKFLGVSAPTKKKNEKIKVDDTDKHILKLLSLNARVEYADLAQKITLSAPAIAQRIKKMEKSGVIEQYSVFLDLAQLGLQQYSVFADCKSINQQKLIAHLSAHPKVCYVADYFGDPFLEFGLFVADPYALRPLLRELENAFSGMKIVDLMFYEDAIQSIGPPVCVFE